MFNPFSPDQSETGANSSLSRFWRNFLDIAAPYWYPTQMGERAFSDVIRSWGMAIFLVLLIAALVALTAFNTFVSNYLVDVIIEWLNDWILGKYFGDRAYYKLNFSSEIENPDQRLAQEIEPITTNTIRFLAVALEKSLEMVTFITILFMISQSVAFVLLAWTFIGNLIAVYLTQELNKINQEELELKANYNYAITHVRNHAESIAFFQGEAQESLSIKRRFKNLLTSTLRKIDWERNTETFNRGYQSAIQIFTFVIIGPLYMNNGDLTFGQVGQACLAANLFAAALGELIAEFGISGQVSSYIERLGEFSETLEKVSQTPENVNTISFLEENNLAFEDLTLQTPDYEKVIVENLSLQVQPGQSLLIVGPSGRGKSSLLRAIAGLWDSGTGRLVRPPLENFLFLPQRPYIILGTLREQLLYPHTERSMTDEELMAILQQVNLQHLLSRVENFDTEAPWENLLSLGEQQRLAFARVLVTRPDFIILDEATSALDLISVSSMGFGTYC